MAGYLETVQLLVEKLAAVEQAVDERERAQTAWVEEMTQRLDTLLDGIVSTTPGTGNGAVPSSPSRPPWVGSADVAPNRENLL
jgi:DNA-binding protein H-NS